MTEDAPSASSVRRAEAAKDPHPLRPTDLELAAGGLSREYTDSDGFAEPDDRRIGPLAALEAVTLQALERPPCLVSFSGGRDSSSVLAAAARVARREGLEPPVPITLRFPDAPMTEESEWQERIVRHLGLTKWEVRQIDDELDLVGPVSAAVLRRHGVLHPFNAFFHRPLLEAARGGSLLTGIGGDYLFGGWHWRIPADVLARRKRPVPRDVLRLAYAASPRSPRSWLRPEARRAVAALDATVVATQPLRWREWVRRYPCRRDLKGTRWSLGLLAEDTDALLLHPLVEPHFLAAVARAGGRHGLGDRTMAMRAIFAGALPDALLARPTKARFDDVIWRRESRDFAEHWDGSGVNERLVDPKALREEWLKPEPDKLSALLLQSAWLNAQGPRPVA